MFPKRYSILQLFVVSALVAIMIGTLALRLRQQSLDRALFDAGIRHDLPEINRLLDRGADPNLSFDKGGPNLMLYAAQIGDRRLVFRLIEAGVDPRGVKGGTNAIEFARRGGFDVIASRLEAAAESKNLDNELTGNAAEEKTEK